MVQSVFSVDALDKATLFKSSTRHTVRVESSGVVVLS